MTNKIRSKYNKRVDSFRNNQFDLPCMEVFFLRTILVFMSCQKRWEEPGSHFNPKCLLAKIACVILAGFSFISVPYFDKQIPAWFGP